MISNSTKNIVRFHDQIVKTYQTNAINIIKTKNLLGFKSKSLAFTRSTRIFQGASAMFISNDYIYLTVIYLLKASNITGVILHDKMFLFTNLLPSFPPKLALLFPLGFATCLSIYIDMYLNF